MPKNEQGETATEVAGNIVMDQLSKQIRERKLTPEILIELGDFNKDEFVPADHPEARGRIP